MECGHRRSIPLALDVAQYVSCWFPSHAESGIDGLMDTTSIVQTRRALHVVAELVLAVPQHANGNGIKLRVCPGGFRTRSSPDLRVDGSDLVRADLHVPIVDTTAAALGEAVGVTPGEAGHLYGDGTGATVDEVINADAAAAEWITQCFESGDAALKSLAPQSDPILWPEHFDVAITLDGVGYGVSPGDDYHALPYAYVGISSPPQNDFWNAPFGASRAMHDLGGVGSVLGFFIEGRNRAAVHHPG